MSAPTAWSDLAAAIKSGLRRIYLWGPPGLGKSYAAREILQGRLNGKATEITLSEDLTVQELCGSYIPQGDHFDWQHGPVVRALKDGHLIVNELTRASGAVLDSMLAVLDVPAIMTLPNNERIQGHDGLSVIATANHPITDLTDALQDRFEADIYVAQPAPSLVTYLNSLTRGLGDVVKNSWAGDGRDGLSPRRAIALATLTANGCDLPRAARITFGKRGSDVAAILALQP